MRGVVVAIAACSVTCASPPPTPGRAPAPSLAELVVGRWADGPSALDLRRDQTFSWDLPVVCRYPPCPLGALSGRWALAEGRLVLTTEEGPWHLGIELGHGPRRLRLDDPATRRAWTLVYRE